MCGIIGIVGTEPVASALYDGLTVLQHRGQDAAGMAVMDGTRIRVHKGRGLVRDVFDEDDIRLLGGRIGIGHCRYPTAGSEGSEEAQPFYVNSPYGIALGHNGNLVNTEALRREVFEQDRRHVNTQSDSEVLLNVLAHELDRHDSLSPDAVFDAVADVHRRCRGGYAIVSVVLGLGLLAFRDPNGIRPLVLGRRESAAGVEYAVASESVALDLTGFTRLRDLQPGEAVIVTPQGELHARRCSDKAEHAPCIFEYVYLARPDSVLDGISVYQARLNLGKTLAQRVVSAVPPSEIDVVIPIPESSRPSATELAQLIGKPYREGFVKNRYVGRTFIMPGQGVRKKSVRQKLNAITSEFAGRNVLLVDDSIVRGTTSKEIVQMAREAGARKVYMASAAPPVRYPNVYGIDMPTKEELVANGRTIEEVRQIIGADALIYQDVDAMKRAVGELNPAVKGFDASCFDGVYVTGDITDGDIDRMNQQRVKTGDDDMDTSRLALPNSTEA